MRSYINILKIVNSINYTIYLNISTNFFIQTIYHRHRTDDNQKSEVFFTSDLIH